MFEKESVSPQEMNRNDMQISCTMSDMNMLRERVGFKLDCSFITDHYEQS